MQNIEVRFNASSNFKKVEAELAALRAQAASLGDVFAKNAYATPPAVTDVSRWKAASRAVHEASNVYRAAASSSGLLSTQQIRATSEAEKYTRALQKQKLTISDMRKHSGIMKQVYQDQLRYQRMTAQYWGTDSAGRAITDIAIPKSVPRDLDTAAQRMHFLGQRIKSASTQMINFGKNAQWAGRQLTVGFTYPLGLIGAAAGVMAYKVDEAMTRVTKVYDVSAEAQRDEALRVKELNEVRERSWALASTAAEKYGQSIENTLEIEQRLAATGLNDEELYKTTEAVSRIATLGDLSVEQSTDMTIALQTAFKDTIKTSEDLTKTFEFMNAVENATSLQLQDIAEATPRAASGLAQLGVTAEQMTVLMVSMREAGVGAAEGANALKSATTRILNPAIVKKATDLYKSFGASIDVQDIVDQSGGNLYEFVRMLGEATAKSEKLTQQQKASAIAALFGTYQFNRLNAALVNVGDAYTGAENQTSRAIKLMSADAKTLGDSAEQEIAQKMEAASGRFQAAWQEMRIELAKAGEPFLAAATYAARAAASILGFFDGMGDWKKNALLGVAAIMAIAGPLVMLGGLAANLGGQFYKGIGRTLTVLGKLGGAVSLVTKEERAAALTAEAQNTAMMKQQQTTSTLAREVNVLTAAYEKATVAARAYAQTQGVANASQAGAAITPAMARTPSGGRFAAWSNDPLPATNVAVNRQATRDAQERLNYVRAEAEATARSANQMKLYAVAGAAATASVASMMFFSNETADNIAKWALIGSMVVPVLSGAAGWMGKIVTDTKAAAALQLTNMRNAVKGTAAVTSMGRAMQAVKAGAMGLGASLNAALGPVGWIALAVTGIAAGITAYSNHQNKIYEEQVKHQNAINNGMKEWSASTGTVLKDYQRIQLSAEATARTVKKTKFNTALAAYSEGGDLEDTTKAYEDIGGAAKKASFIIDRFIELQVRAGYNAVEAKQDITAMLIASGMSAADAARRVDELLDKIGKVSAKDLSLQVEATLDLLNYDNEDTMIDSAKRAAEVWGSAFRRAQNPEDARALVDQLNRVSEQGFDRVFSMLSERGKKEFAEAGVDSIESFYDAINRRDNRLKLGTQTAGPGYDYNDVLDAAKQAALMESALASAVGQSQLLGDNFSFINDVMAQWDITRMTQSYDEAVESSRMMLQAAQSAADWDKDRALSNVKSEMNLINQAQGYALGATAAEAFYNLTNRIKESTKGAADEADNVGKNIESIPTRKTVKISVEQVGGIVQTAMSNVQSRMAESAMDQFNAGWDSRMEAAQSAWDSRSEALQASHERAMRGLERSQEAAQEAFDRRWEARREAIEKAYQKRIDRVNREIEAEQRADEIRQRLFEKEKARLARLAELGNANIDFNTALNEGRLDDAAKTLNNAGADAGNAQMEAEQAAAEKRTEARIKALEKKNERLEKQRDKELKNLEKLEERMRKHLERVQEARRRALEKQQRDEVKALERSEKAAMDSLDKQREYEEATLQQRLDLFKAYTARNKKDLERWMRELGFEYDDFGDNVEKKGQSWAKTMRESLLDEIREAGEKVKSDTMWEEIGETMGKKLVKGLGFNGLADFRKFVKTGERAGKGDKGGNVETRHEGGVVGSGGGSRKGVPNTYRGLHRSETMVRAQKGEYIINKKSSAVHRDTLDAINSGNFDSSGRRKPRSGGPAPMEISESSGYGGPAALMSGVISHMFRKGVAEAFDNNYQIGLKKERRRERRMAHLFGGTGSRNYNVGPVKPWVQEAANYLGNKYNVGSIGGYRASATDPNGHPAGRALDFMVGLTQGNAMMKEIIRLHGPLDAEYAIWRQRITGGSRPWGTWSKMEDRGSPTANHMDHIHLNFNASGDTGDLPALGSGGSRGGKGSGSYWRASEPGKGWTNSHDYKNGMRSPVYAVGPGEVRTYTLPPSAGSGQHPNAQPRGYGSYGVVSELTTGGKKILYAHLYPGTQVSGRVQGGQQIALSASTGNSSGPHTHFEVNGSTNAKGAFAAMGIPLRTGGTIKYDNTPANLHRGETVLTAPLTQKFKDAVSGAGGGDTFHVTLDLRGAMIKEDVDIKKAVNAAIDERENKLGRKRVVR